MFTFVLLHNLCITLKMQNCDVLCAHDVLWDALTCKVHYYYFCTNLEKYKCNPTIKLIP